MHDYKVLSVRLNKREAEAIEKLARDNEVTVSELVRLWLDQAAKCTNPSSKEEEEK